MNPLYVGIDGGGTSCRARIQNDQGQVLGEAKAGSANVFLGVDIAMASVIQSVTGAAAQAGLSEADFSRMYLGLALAGAENQNAWQRFMKLPNPFAQVVLNTDAYGACLGAHNGNNGAILIAGTGSCGLFLQDGVEHVVGGKEFPISDHGSGAMMGLRLIQEVLLAVDGMKPFTPLATHVMATFDNSVDQVVEWSKTARPCDYGQFSPVVFEFAENRDPLAVDMLKQTAADVEMLFNGLLQKGAEEVAMMGSIGERIIGWLPPVLKQHIILPKGDAMDGALIMARSPDHNLF